MTHRIVIGAPDQTRGYELRSLVEEIDDFTVLDVADTTGRVESQIASRDPDIVLLHADLGPQPVLGLIRDIVARRPGVAVILLTDDLTADTFGAAMDAGARGAVQYPVTLAELQARLTAAAGWVTQMRKHLTNEHDEAGGSPLRGQLVVVAGSKGGTGTTTVAAHLAHDAVARVPGRSVCLVDLDLDKGDIGHLFGITHRLDISDLAKVADDLSMQTVSSAIHRSAAGLSTLLAPTRIEDIGSVGEREVVLILAALRRQFDLVIADVGAAVTPVTAAAVETATQVVLVATPDVLALRGVHRVVDAWRRVGVRKSEDVHILLNRVSKERDIQPETAGRLVPAAPLDDWLPEAFKPLERGINYQTPDQVVSSVWWNHVHRLADTIGTVSNDRPEAVVRKSTRSLLKSRKKAEPVGEAGQATIEFTALIPLILFLVIIMWQVALWGMSAAFAGHAADEASRAASLGDSPSRVEAVALDAVPSWFRSGMDVSTNAAESEVSVRASLPVLVPSITTDYLTYTSTVGYVPED
jgi:pilus assembly protein CpaE